MSDEEIRIAAIEFAKHNKEKIAKELTDKTLYLPSAMPISVFMAGSPGAGKTELSRNFISLLGDFGDELRGVVRINGDDVRARIPGYTGSNSNLVHGAASLIVEKMHDLVLHNNQNFILDGTFSKHEKALKNINRSLGKKRSVFILYVFQKPEIAWKFTEARERVEGRNIPRQVFIDEFLGAMQTVKAIHKEFGNEGNVHIFIVKKNYESNLVEDVETDPQQDFIDRHLDDGYTPEALEKLLP